MTSESDTSPEELSSRQRTQLLAGLVGTGATMVALSPVFIVPARRRLDRYIEDRSGFVIYSCPGQEGLSEICGERVLAGINRLGGTGIAFVGIGVGFGIVGVSTLAKSWKLRRKLYIGEMALGGTLFITGGVWALATSWGANPYFTAIPQRHDFERREWADRYLHRRLGHGIIGASMASLGLGLLGGSVIAYVVEKYVPRRSARTKRVTWHQGPQINAGYMGVTVNGRF